MSDKIVSENPFKLKCCHDRYKTQKMCNKAVDNFLPALEVLPGWFVTRKMNKKLLTGFIRR